MKSEELEANTSKVSYSADRSCVKKGGSFFARPEGSCGESPLQGDSQEPDSGVKKIVIKKYLEHLDGTFDENETLNIINNLYLRFINEDNENNRIKCENDLKDYIFIKKGIHIPNGRYVRWINTTDAKDMPLKCGGFVTNDNGYSLTVKNRWGVFRVSRRNHVFFCKMNDTDRMFIALDKFENRN